MHNRTTKKSVKKYSENQLENMVCEVLKKQKWETLKFFSPYNTGWMDRIFLSPGGATLWIEFKKPTGKLAARQKLNRNWLISNDHSYYILDSYELCMWFVNQVAPFIH